MQVRQIIWYKWINHCIAEFNAEHTQKKNCKWFSQRLFNTWWLEYFSIFEVLYQRKSYLSLSAEIYSEAETYKNNRQKVYVYLKIEDCQSSPYMFKSSWKALNHIFKLWVLNFFLPHRQCSTEKFGANSSIINQSRVSWERIFGGK